MEEKININSEELSELNEKLAQFIRQAQGIKSTIEILQDKEAMDMIRESEELEKKGVTPIKIEI